MNRQWKWMNWVKAMGVLEKIGKTCRGYFRENPWGRRNIFQHGGGIAKFDEISEKGSAAAGSEMASMRIWRSSVTAAWRSKRFPGWANRQNSWEKHYLWAKSQGRERPCRSRGWFSFLGRMVHGFAAGLASFRGRSEGGANRWSWWNWSFSRWGRLRRSVRGEGRVEDWNAGEIQEVRQPAGSQGHSTPSHRKILNVLNSSSGEKRGKKSNSLLTQGSRLPC